MSEEMRSICEEFCDREPAASFAAGLVCCRHEGSAAEAWKRAPKEWRRLKPLAGFWK